MAAGAEYLEVEKPLLDQLGEMGWSTLEASKWEPDSSGRENFKQVVLEERLRKALVKLNPGPDGEAWLDDARLDEAISAIVRVGPGELLEVNQAVTELLLEGTAVTGVRGWDQGRSQSVDFIDFSDPTRNEFLAVSQFRVDEPGGQAHRFVVPDVVLFVNGIPLVVIECKSPYIIDPMIEGIDQLRRYANRRELGMAEGNETLFYYNQFVVSSYGDRARVGTFTSGPEHFAEWRDCAPLSREELGARLDKRSDQLSGQELLVAGMLQPENLLDLVRHFTLFMELGEKRVKVVARYQQYRAVVKALHRLRHGKTRASDGEHDRRGGLVWHTQGSGKSLTMVFLVRAMRSDPALQAFKIVVVTDRTDLEKQLSDTAKLTGEGVRRARKVAKLRELLSEEGAALVFAMIQKYRDTDKTTTESGLIDDEKAEPFGELNADSRILVMVDEAHRSQTSELHANLMAGLPNAAKIGFTGTPIMKEGKKKTTGIFGPEIDRYTIREAEADEAVVPIYYEGRTAKGAVVGGSDLDELFEDMFVDHTPEEIEKLKARYATTGAVLEAPLLIAAKARSMLLHYVSTVLPEGFKAQVSATSRLAVVRYREALLQARDQIVSEIEALPEALVERLVTGELDLESMPRKRQVLLRAHQHLRMIKDLDFVPVISGDHNDPPDWAQWTEKSRQDVAITNFKKALGPAGQDTSPVAFVLVRTMLLTGFDAPVAQVLYLDRFIQDAELLQAIARVNRTAKGKKAGLFVDYFGVGAHLQKALKAYAAEDAADTVGALTAIGDELPKLRERHDATIALFLAAGISNFDSSEDVEACVDLLSDERGRAQFNVLLKRFLATLDTVMPRPEALPYLQNAKRLGLIQKLARRRYRDDGGSSFDVSLYGAKVRELIDEHVSALDIENKIPPVSILSPDFLSKVNSLPSDRAKASEMEHALKFHIRKNFDKDPASFSKLSERLDEILRTLTGRWDELTAALEKLLRDAEQEEAADRVHDDVLVARFFGLLESVVSTGASVDDDLRLRILQIATMVVGIVEEHSAVVRFWQNAVAQEKLLRALIHLLDEHDDLFPFDDQPAVADQLLELARANASEFRARRDGRK